MTYGPLCNQIYQYNIVLLTGSPFCDFINQQTAKYNSGSSQQKLRYATAKVVITSLSKCCSLFSIRDVVHLKKSKKHKPRGVGGEPDVKRVEDQSNYDI